MKDPTLVLIGGVYDLLGTAPLAVNDPKWTGHAAEGFVFAGLVFFVICFAIYRLSLWIEGLLGAGEGARLEFAFADTGSCGRAHDYCRAVASLYMERPRPGNSFSKPAIRCLF